MVLVGDERRTAAAAPDVMHDAHAGHEVHLGAGLAHAAAPVGVLAVHEVALVERADAARELGGRNLVHAYDVMTMGEETALLRALQVKLVKTEPREAGGTYYNMHEVQDPTTLKTHTIFVNVSKPMDFLEYQRQNKDTTFVIPRQ